MTLFSRRWLPAADSRRFLSRIERRLSKACDLKVYAKTPSDRLMLVRRQESRVQSQNRLQANEQCQPAIESVEKAVEPEPWGPRRELTFNPRALTLDYFWLSTLNTRLSTLLNSIGPWQQSQAFSSNMAIAQMSHQ